MHTYIVTCAYRYTYAHIFILVYVCQLVIQLARCVRTYRHAYLNAYTYVYTQLVFASNHRPQLSPSGIALGVSYCRCHHMALYLDSTQWVATVSLLLQAAIVA